MASPLLRPFRAGEAIPKVYPALPDPLEGGCAAAEEISASSRVTPACAAGDPAQSSPIGSPLPVCSSGQAPTGDPQSRSPKATAP